MNAFIMPRVGRWNAPNISYLNSRTIWAPVINLLIRERLELVIPLFRIFLYFDKSVQIKWVDVNINELCNVLHFSTSKLNWLCSISPFIGKIVIVLNIWSVLIFFFENYKIWLSVCLKRYLILFFLFRVNLHSKSVKHFLNRLRVH